LNKAGFDKADFDLINFLVQEQEEALAEGPPVTALDAEGNYNAEILLRALKNRAVEAETGDRTKVDDFKDTSALIVGNGFHWSAFVHRKGKWWHVEKAFCAPIHTISSNIRAAMGRNGMFLRVKAPLAEEESTQDMLLNIQSSEPAAPLLQLAPNQEEVQQTVPVENHFGDQLAGDAPSSKKSSDGRLEGDSHRLNSCACECSRKFVPLPYFRLWL
jgi:hypothetical protein